MKALLSKINLLERIKSDGTGQGVIVIIGIIIMAILHPEEAKKYLEIVAMVLIYGGFNILKKDKLKVQTPEQTKMGLPKEVANRLVDISLLDRPDPNIMTFLDPQTGKKYEWNKLKGETCQIS